MTFPAGTLLGWADDVPDTWRFIHTPGPLRVEDVYFQTGKPNDYAKRFHPDGFSLEPGNIYQVSFSAKKSTYYDPPLSFYIGDRGTILVHEKWLRLAS
jgi:hypothetical protein